MIYVVLLLGFVTLYLCIHTFQLTIKYDDLRTRVNMLFMFAQTRSELESRPSAQKIYDQSGTLIFDDFGGVTEPMNIDNYVVDTEDTNAPSGRAREGSQS